MINIERAVNEKFPSFASKPDLIRKPTISLLRRIIHEPQINEFLDANQDAEGLEFINRVFEYFNFSYTVTERDRQNIPAIGRVVIFANHPIGSLDGLAIIKLICEVRPDVKILANDLLNHFSALNRYLIPLDNMTGGSARKSYKQVLKSLEHEEAIIVFPAGEVSRAHATGVKDNRWLPGFLNFARRAKAPLLPVHINAKNSLLFYSASMVYKPLGTALLAHEMFKQRSRVIKFRIGEPIPSESLETKGLHDRTLVKRLKRHLYKIGRRQSPLFETVKTIAHPEDRQQILAELNNAESLGETRDGNRIYLVDYSPNSSVINEIGRLRELAFRKVGEGTGCKRDLDKFDQYYKHLVLWDSKNLEIAGAYRLGIGKEILANHGMKGFYTSTLYKFEHDFEKYLQYGVELGRSFVNPNYWGKASLDYLWQGIGSYLAHNQDIRYLIGPVSMSADYPKELKDMLAHFYRTYHKSPETMAEAFHPYLLSEETIENLNGFFNNLERDDAFDKMQSQFKAMGHRLPVLFKQYAAIFEDGGFTSLVFSVDPDFGDCLDGLCMADITRLKIAKRKRYIDETTLS